VQIPQAPIPYPGPQSYPAGPPDGRPAQGSRLRRFFRDPLSIVLVVVIVVALAAAGVLGAELYARHRADTVVAQAVQCIVQDTVDVSFGARPFLLQYATEDYSGISIKTAGNQIRQAKGMQVDLNIDNVKLADTGTSKGTIGSLDATINWSSDGIKQTVQSAIPILGGIVSNVTTNPSDGTIELVGVLGNVTAKPEVTDGGLALEVVSVTGLGFTLPKESVQPALDAFTSALTNNYPLGIKADSVQVTQSGVLSKFSTQNASIPEASQNACFAGI
jgi:LmeA-like phospholipid-binding